MSVLLGSSGASVILGSSGGGVVRRTGGGTSGKTVLAQSDFTYLGYYDLDLGGEFSYGYGLTHRYVSSELRFLAIGHDGGSMKYRLHEIVAPTLNGTVSTSSTIWSDPWVTKRGDANGQWHGLWWDESGGRVWLTSAIDYPDDTYIHVTKALNLSVLGSGGTVTSTRGQFGLENIGARAIYGGVTPIPSWFQTAHGVGPYAVGFGGYTSRMSQGKVPSMGLMLVAVPEPTTYTDEDDIPASAYTILADHRSGTTQSAAGTGYDRGRRTSGVYTNYMDNGLDYQALGREPITGTDPTGTWNNGRWVWTDSGLGNGAWIDLPTKHGFVLVPHLTSGDVWYQSSTIQFDGTTAEFQVFDPDGFGEVVNSTRNAYDVAPSSQWTPSWASLIPNGLTGRDSGYPLKTVKGVSWDSTAGRLYLRFSSADGTWPNLHDRILVWSVS
jgi:hypothetical protein